jgi:protein ImuB
MSAANVSSTAAAIWLALYVPRLPAVACLLGTTTGASSISPVAIIEGNPNSIVIAYNRAAEALGICEDMTLANALTLCPSLKIMARDPNREQQVTRWVAMCACQYASEVSLALPQAVLLEVRPSLNLFSGLDQLTRQLIRDIRKLGIPVWPAAAPTPLAAWLLAMRNERSKILQREELPDVLDGIPVSHLPAAAQHLSALNTLGLETLGTLKQQPRAGLNQRFGQALVQSLDHLYGDAPHVLPLFQPPMQFSERLVLPAPMANLEMLQFGLARLLRAMCRFLTMRGLGITQLEIAFGHEDQPPTLITVGVALTRTEAHMIRVVRERLARVTLTWPAESIAVHSVACSQLHSAQQSLIADDTSNRNAEADEVMDRVRARISDERVHQLSLFADHRPEFAYRLSQSMGQGMNASVLRTKTRISNSPNDGQFQANMAESPRPVWLLKEPKQLKGVPQTLGYRLLQGPERIESGWWDGLPVKRDYFSAESRTGQRCWLFRTANGEWFMHGLFA